MPEKPDGSRLLDPHELAQAGPAEAIRLPLELIDPNPRNPRGKLVELDALAASIKDVSLLHPIAVRRVGERYEVLGGHRRLAAFAVLRDREPLDPQWRTIPAVVHSLDDDRAYLAAITSQVHTRGWRPREEAAALEVLVLGGRSLDQIGTVLHKSAAWTSKRLRVYSDAVLSALVQTDQLSTAVAEELLPILSVESRKQFAERAVAEGWSKEQARAHVRGLRLSTQLDDLDRKVLELIDLLSHLNGSRVSIAVFRNLHVLHGRIDVLAAEARGEPPKLPSIEAAEAAAGVTAQGKRRAEAIRQDTQLRRRKLPPR